jgi:murein DD-endopeptidase MepM/ murein hydrolase activator NlpD
MAGVRITAARVVLCVAGVLAVATPALGDDIAGKKRAVDAQITTLTGQLAAKRQSEQALRDQIDQVTSRIRTLEASVGDVSLKLSTLEEDLALHRDRLAKLTKLFDVQTARLILLRRQYELAVQRLDRRLVSIYVSGEPSLLEFVFGATSIDDVLTQVDYMSRIGREDREIATEVANAKLAMATARTRTEQVRRQVASAAHVITARAAQVRETRDALVSARDSLSVTKEHQLVALSSLSASEQAEASEIDALQASSAALGDQIRAEQAKAAAAAAAASSSSGASTTTATPSSAGLIWPVSGPITSPFGWRWGRMHQGIDIGVGYGTPIHAAAAGTVIYCGWETGYGNLVVIDHGNNLATAYAHQSSIAVSCGQQVTQGQVIGYVGATGHATGPHLHFEVRVDGNPVDPLGYL